MSQSPDKSGVVVTTTGAYNIDYDAAYAARKFDKRQGRFEQQPMFGGVSGDIPRELSRDEMLQSLEHQFHQERSKSGEKRIGGGATVTGDSPVPR